jgi:hypothetical protein
MFFGPSKQSLSLAQGMPFLAKNYSRDLFMNISTGNDLELKEYALENKGNYHTWSRLAESVCLVEGLSALGKSNPKGKLKLLQVVMTIIKNDSELVEDEIMDCHQHTHETTSQTNGIITSSGGLLPQNFRFVIYGDWIKSRSLGRRCSPAEKLLSLPDREKILLAKSIMPAAGLFEIYWRT